MQRLLLFTSPSSSSSTLSIIQQVKQLSIILWLRDVCAWWIFISFSHARISFFKLQRIIDLELQHACFKVPRYDRFLYVVHFSRFGGSCWGLGNENRDPGSWCWSQARIFYPGEIRLCILSSMLLPLQRLLLSWFRTLLCSQRRKLLLCILKIPRAKLPWFNMSSLN